MINWLIWALSFFKGLGFFLRGGRTLKYLYTQLTFCVYIYSKNLRAQLFTPLVKPRKEILWKISAFKICFIGVSPFSIKNQLEIEKLAYVGFGFVWAAGKIFKERPRILSFHLLCCAQRNPLESYPSHSCGKIQLSKIVLWTLTHIK